MLYIVKLKAYNTQALGRNPQNILRRQETERQVFEMRVSMSRNTNMILLSCPWEQFSSQEVTIFLLYVFRCSGFLLIKTHVWMQSLTAVFGETVNMTQKIQYPSPDLNQNLASPSSLTTVSPPPQHATKTHAHERRTKNLGFTFKHDSITEKFGKYNQVV